MCSVKLIAKGQLDNYTANIYFLRGLPKKVRDKVIRSANVQDINSLLKLGQLVLIGKAK